MRFSTSRLSVLVGALAAALALTACSGGGGDEDKTPAKDSPPSKADFKKAQTELKNLKGDYQAVYNLGARVQSTAATYFKDHPDGTADDAALKPVTTQFDDAVKKRDDATDEVEKLKALDDPDVAKAYKTFAAKAEKGNQYYDSLYAAFPLLDQSFAACSDVFASTKLDTSPTSPAEYGRTILAQYRKAIADCLPVLDKLSTSENASLAAWGSGFAKIVTARRALMTRLSTDHISMPAFSTQYKQLGARSKTVGESLDFQKQLNALSPVPEFLAMEKVVKRKAA